MQQRTSFHPPASVYTGAVNEDYEDAIRHCQASHFAVSSNSTIKTAVQHWEPFALEHGLPTLIPDGDPKRGGIAASFAASFCADNKRPLGLQTAEKQLYLIGVTIRKPTPRHLT